MKITVTVLVVLAVARTTHAQDPATVAATTDAATTAAATTAAATTAAGGGGGATTAAGGGGGGTTAAGGGGGATTAAPGTAGTAATASSPVSCLSCDETHDSCDNATENFSNTVMCTSGCWVYREESGGNITVSRGCGRTDTSDTTCSTEQMSERCMTVSGVNVCRRCCNEANCNHSELTLTGTAAAAHVSLGVLTASLVMALLVRVSA